MNAQMTVLEASVVILAVLCLVLITVTIYLVLLVLHLSEQVERMVWPPQVDRDGNGRRIRERL